ncbi:hypothetical protein FA13DRAFT_1182296 [Coprinellus micaceus]|uniref:Uncharacterized protein n=1 Tax=Coprinellus micaceus TaxID=71717 RepID=A0A4Y7RBX9_COPMI|nr:hypothetical protein FA13DRAFT_1182296 [Coprinellus micaceus]
MYAATAHHNHVLPANGYTDHHIPHNAHTHHIPHPGQPQAPAQAPAATNSTAAAPHPPPQPQPSHQPHPPPQPPPPRSSNRGLPPLRETITTVGVPSVAIKGDRLAVGDAQSSAQPAPTRLSRSSAMARLAQCCCVTGMVRSPRIHRCRRCNAVRGHAQSGLGNGW